MIHDYIEYLSGWIPLGIWLPILTGVFLSFTLWVIWAGTGFWKWKKFWKFLFRIWFFIFLIYVGVWFIKPSPPIPERIVLYTAPVENPQNSWMQRGIYETLKERISISSNPFVLLTQEYIPILKNDFDSEQDLYETAEKLNALWIISIKSGKDKSPGCVVNVSERSGDSFLQESKFECQPDGFLRNLKTVADKTAGTLGENHISTWWPSIPALVSDSIVIEYFQALESASEQNSDSLLARFKEIRERYPNWSSLHREIAVIYERKQGGYFGNEIQTSLLKSLDIDQDNIENLLLLAEFFLDDREWDKAESALRLAMNFDISEPRIFFLLSRLNENRLEDTRYKTEKDVLERVLYLAPGYEAARLSLKDWFIDMREKRPAALIVEDGLEIDPESISLLLSLSALQLEMSRLEEAFRTCDRILEIHPHHPGALYNKGVGSIWQEKYEQAIEYLEESYQHGGTVDNIYYIGIAYQKMHQFDKAIEYFQKRFSLSKSSDDQVAVSCRKRIGRIRAWLAKQDSLKEKQPEK